MKLQNKVAIVTGAGSGVGKAIAELFAREGAKVVVSDINKESAEEVVEGITFTGGTAIAASREHREGGRRPESRRYDGL